VVIPELDEIEGACELASRIEWIELLRGLATGRADWRGPEAVARSAGIEAEKTADMLASLDSAGWIDCDADHPAGLAVCLSTLGADRLGVKITEVGPGEVPVWSRANFAERTKVRKQPGQVYLSELPGADPYPDPSDDDTEDPSWYDLPDKGPGPAELAGQAEDAERAWAEFQSDPYPRLRPPMELKPSIILGTNAQWHGPRSTPPKVCPGCRNKPIASNVACVYESCDRWGGAEKPAPRKGRRQGASSADSPNGEFQGSRRDAASSAN
jgi:hypothetical protein